MKLKCIENRGYPHITIGQSYVVFGGKFILDESIKKYTLFRIEDDYGSIRLYKAENFHIESNHNTRYKVEDLGMREYQFNYHIVSYPKFWSMFYDDIERAQLDYQKAKKELYRYELDKIDMINIVTRGNKAVKNFVIELLREDKDDVFLETIINSCKETI